MDGWLIEKLLSYLDYGGEVVLLLDCGLMYL